VTRSGQTWRAKVTNTNVPPSSGTTWELLAARGLQGLQGPRGPAGPNTGIAAGTASVPAISFNGDPNTGIYSPGADQIALVEGGALFLHSIGLGNTALGVAALSNNTGDGNTAVGGAALLHNTTGSYNTGLGDAALGYNTTGRENAAVGDTALWQNTSGSHNAALGRGALRSNTTGWYNTAVGGDALHQNTDGGYNTAIGFQALYTPTIGGYNTAAGVNALFSDTTGSNNTAVGLNALFTNTTGFENTAVGSGALYANTGTDNAALGYNALVQNTSGINNVALGVKALGSNTTGNVNIGIGTSAGYFATASSNSIFISNTGAAGDTKTIKIGTKGVQTSTYIAGIAGVFLDGMDANNNPVGINIPTHQLGLFFEGSSRRYKKDIHAMPDMSAMLMKLHPVTFRYKKPSADGTHPLRYGLIAEEVAEVFPHLAVFKDGRPETVRYNELPKFLLAGYQAQQKVIDALTKSDREKAARIVALERRLSTLEAALSRSTKAALH
jgi:hypothetical protein